MNSSVQSFDFQSTPNHSVKVSSCQKQTFEKVFGIIPLAPKPWMHRIELGTKKKDEYVGGWTLTIWLHRAAYFISVLVAQVEKKYHKRELFCNSFLRDQCITHTPNLKYVDILLINMDTDKIKNISNIRTEPGALNVINLSERLYFTTEI